MKTFVILPARMKSSRLPNKLIKNIGEMTLIEHMIARAKKIKDAISAMLLNLIISSPLKDK